MQRAQVLSEGLGSRRIDDAQRLAEHQEVRVVQAREARAEARTRPRSPALIAHLVVTRVAIEEHELRPDAVTRTLRVENRREDLERPFAAFFVRKANEHFGAPVAQPNASLRACVGGRA